MSGDLKAEMKKAIAAGCSKEGIPPVIDKTYNSIWEQFKKSQPLKLAEKGLNDQWKDSVDIWVTLQQCIEKFGVNKKVTEFAMKKLKAKYGETPSETEVRLMVT